MNYETISNETVICRSEALLSNNLGDDVVMMDIEQGSYYGLEGVAARIWELTENPVSFGKVCEQLSNEYDILPDKCRQEVTSFLDDLLERKIVMVIN